MFEEYSDGKRFLDGARTILTSAFSLFIIGYHAIPFCIVHVIYCVGWNCIVAAAKMQSVGLSTLPHQRNVVCSNSHQYSVPNFRIWKFTRFYFKQYSIDHTFEPLFLIHRILLFDFIGRKICKSQFIAVHFFFMSNKIRYLRASSNDGSLFEIDFIYTTFFAQLKNFIIIYWQFTEAQKSITRKIYFQEENLKYLGSTLFTKDRHRQTFVSN